MTQFETFFKLGLHHILDLQAFDHLLFVVVLCAAVPFKQWRLLVGLITAFTIGHCASLVGTAYIDTRSIQFFIEICIPLTIMASAIGALAKLETSRFNYQYGLIVVFGLIHGMGFANYIKSMLFDSDRFLTSLFYFNVGIEVGQLVIVGISLAIIRLLVYLLPSSENLIKRIILYVALLLSIFLLYNLFS